jgi:hypothetical protein
LWRKRDGLLGAEEDFTEALVVGFIEQHIEQWTAIGNIHLRAA